MLGEFMKRNCNHGLFTVLAIFALCVLIFYQLILTFIIPLRFNIFILLIEILALLFFLYQIIWPY